MIRCGILGILLLAIPYLRKTSRRKEQRSRLTPSHVFKHLFLSFILSVHSSQLDFYEYYMSRVNVPVNEL